ncbi:MAG: SURF1 family protein [Proteobacteria bacterium]|nr:SURF1 family protein [Pseudomonadota bacterium]
MSLKLKLFVAFILATSVVEGGLGLWQWNRRAEKTAFIAAMQKAASSPALPYAGAGLWHRVEVTGKFLNQHTAYVRTSQKRGPDSVFGVLVMTPLATRVCGSDGRCALQTIYVNRGFLPTAADGKIPAYERPDEPVTLVGILRPAETASLFQPSNDPAKKVWFNRDVAAMAKVAQLPGAEAPSGSPYDRFLDREAVKGESPPFGTDARALVAAIPDNHFTYALTWWGLMLTNLVVLGFFLFRRKDEDATR